MADETFTTTLKPSAQVVAEALIEYAQDTYEIGGKIGWDSYAAYTLGVLSALCGNYEVDDETDTPAGGKADA